MKLLTNFSILFWLALVLTSCSQQQEVNQKVFRYNQPNNISSLDPAFAKSQNNIWAIDHLFDGLVTLDSEMNVAPAIAKEWSISEDGLHYTFHLNPDVWFHSDPCFGSIKTRKVKASDFEYSFLRIISPKVNSPGSWIFSDKVGSNRPFEAVNDSTFVIHLTSPFIPFLGILTMEYCSVIAPESDQVYGSELRNHPVGTGPFYLYKWLENQAMFLRPHIDYFAAPDGWPHLDGVKISFIADRKTAYLEFVQGNIDFLSGLESSFINDLLSKNGELRAHHRANIQFSTRAFLNTEYLGINLEAAEPNSPLHDRRYRQALNYAIDREQMLKNLRNGVGQAADAGFIPPGLPAYDAKKNPGFVYDPAKARGLVEEIKAYNAELPVIELHVNKDYVDICTYVQKAWEKVGIPSKIQLDESSLLREAMRKGNIDLFRASWIADYPDEESFLNVFYSGNQAPPNYTRFKNEKFDQLYRQSLTENDRDERQLIYQEMNQIVIDESPVVFLYYDETAIFYRSEIQGVKTDAFKLLKLHDVRIERD